MWRYFKALGRISELEERVTKLEGELSDKDLDWLDMRARCRRLLDRTEKAAARVQSAEGGQTQETAPLALSPSNGGGRLLTPHQLEVQQHILKRRAGGSAA